MAIIILALKSVWNRWVTAFLTVIMIAFSVTLLLGVERIRLGAKASFANTISGTDLIVGARSGPLQLLLYSVFRIGNATNNLSWKSYQEIAKHNKVKWTIPISLGDSHHGFRVLGTNTDYFKYYRYRKIHQIELEKGKVFDDIFEIVLGSEVAKTLGYQLGQPLVIAHGIGKTSFMKHEDKPFRVVGVLKKTGTPVDRTLHVSLESIEAIHIDWKEGVLLTPDQKISSGKIRQLELYPEAITAFFIGLKSRVSTFQLQRFVNEYQKEPLLAILPGSTLHQLWSMIGTAEQALLIISAFVVLIGLMGMLTSILTSLNERRREMAILRSIGARPWHIFSLMVSEAGILSLIGTFLGIILLYLCLFIGQPLIESQFGLFIVIETLTPYDMAILLMIVIIGFLMGIFPAWRAYHNSLLDGMTVRI